MSDHLTVSTSDRGFRALPPIDGEYGGEVTVYESSAASAPHLWLAVVVAAKADVRVHLTADSAWKLAEQLQYLVEHHYQGDARPGSS